ncbi:MAG: hypothetical protein H6649_13285 [Caldilineae bacterium]|nr:hypothetical protein [Caldilineae bacterium]
MPFNPQRCALARKIQRPFRHLSAVPAGNGHTPFGVCAWRKPRRQFWGRYVAGTATGGWRSAKIGGSDPWEQGCADLPASDSLVQRVRLQLQLALLVVLTVEGDRAQRAISRRKRPTGTPATCPTWHFLRRALVDSSDTGRMAIYYSNGHRTCTMAPPWTRSIDFKSTRPITTCYSAQDGAKSSLCAHEHKRAP